VSIVMPLPSNPLKSSPFTVLVACRCRPSADVRALPSIVIPGEPSEKSGWVVPSIVTGCVIAGSALASEMRLSPLATLVKSIVSAAESPLAAAIASRSVHSVTSQVPSPGSTVELT
jgi:hypothetical protein